MNGNCFEVEVKHCHGDFAPLREKLKAMLAFPGGSFDEVDTYYQHPNRDFAQSGEALRVRAKNRNSYLCYKGPKQGGPAKVREEIELSVSGPEIGPLLLALGFNPFKTISKTRELWTVEKPDMTCQVCLDDAHGLGHFVELEVIAPKEEISWAQNFVLNLALELGLGVREDRSYLRMHLEKCL